MGPPDPDDPTRTGADRGLPATPAEPLHLRQAVSPRLLGRAGPVVPRGRGLRGPADRHPAAGARQGHRRAARHRLPLPRARRPELDQPADGVPEGSPRPDRGLDDQPRGPEAGGLGRGVRRLAGHAVRRALPVVPRQPRHRRGRLLDRARGRRTRSRRRRAGLGVAADRAPAAPAGPARPARPPRRGPGVRPGRGAAGRPMAGHGPRGRDPAAPAVAGRTRARRGPVRGPTRASHDRPLGREGPLGHGRGRATDVPDLRMGLPHQGRPDGPRLDGERRPAPRADR